MSGLLVGLSIVRMEEADTQLSERSATTNMTGVTDLWAGMHEIGMISDEQCRHMQEAGYLPGGSTVTNSPITAESQAH